MFSKLKSKKYNIHLFMSKNVLYAWVDLISSETAIWGEYYKKISGFFFFKQLQTELAQLKAFYMSHLLRNQEFIE